MCQITAVEIGGKIVFGSPQDYLIDNSEIVLAYWDKQPYGGTYYTVGKARIMNRIIINLYK